MKFKLYVNPPFNAPITRQSNVPERTIGMKYIDNNGFYPYRKRNLLTNNEYRFYCGLVRIADKYNLSVLIKMRLADLIEVDTNRINKTDYMKYFGKIKSKHIDFVLAEKYTMKMIVAIELDDKTHQRPDRIERDALVNNALTAAGIHFVRCYDLSAFEPLLIHILQRT
ncbi:MAG: DUF2726 domain-containing protein [Ruminococcus sp.]|nr:DUF2726 domain-containing protein [Ruminococcus sp.]